MDKARGQSPLTVVADTISSAGGGNPSGTITISWRRYEDNSVPRKVIFPGSKTVIVTNGAFSTSLFPNTVALQPGGCYEIAYRLNAGNNNQTRYWYVPVSATPVNLNDVETSIPCPTQSGAIVAPGQINGGNAQPGYVLTWNGTYAYWAAGGGGGGSNPGGTNGQLQYNNLGALGGFTPAGDCVLNRPNYICTKTNGVAFAASATTDTTNAANISSGILLPARGGTGTGALSTGSIPFVGAAGVYSQDGRLFWDSTNGYVGIGTNAPGSRLDVAGSGIVTATVRSSDNEARLTVTGALGRIQNTTGDFHIDNAAAGSNLLLTVNAGQEGLKITSQQNVLIGRMGAFDNGYRLDVHSRGDNGLVRLYDQTVVTGVTDLYMRAGAGQGSTPFMLFQDNTLNTIAQIGYDGSFGSYAAGIRTAVLTGNTVGLGSGGLVGFRSATSWDAGAVDVGLRRNAAGIIEIDSGTLGAFRDLQLRNLTGANGTFSTMAGAGVQCVQTDNNGQLFASGLGGCLSGGNTPYSTTVSSSTSTTILAATHARGTTPLATCLDNSTPKVIVQCSYTRNISGDLVFAFNPAFTGSIEVRP